MSRLIGALLACASLMLLAPGASQAAGFQPAVGGADMQAATQIAAQQWGGPSCGGQVQVSWGALPPLVNARSTWSNPTDVWANPGQNFDCSVVLNVAQSFDWPKLCTVLVHELGHLAGHQHSSDPADVMAPIYSAPLAACAGTPEPEAPARPAVQDPVSGYATVIPPVAARDAELRPTARPAPVRRASAFGQSRRALARARARARAARVRAARDRAAGADSLSALALTPGGPFGRLGWGA